MAAEPHGLDGESGRGSSRPGVRSLHPFCAAPSVSTATPDVHSDGTRLAVVTVHPYDRNGVC